MNAVPKLWFVRHGQTDWNAEGRLQGSRDTLLNTRGRMQATDAASRLRRIAGTALADADFLSSPLMRARETMAILRSELALPVDDYHVDPRLQEINFGQWEGSTWAEIRRSDPIGAAARDRDRWDYRPNGADAESYAMLTERVASLTQEITRPTVVVAHGGVARALLVVFGHLDKRSAVRTSIRQGSVLVLNEPGWRWA